MATPSGAALRSDCGRRWIAAAGIVGPAAGGLALTFGGPSLAFGAAAVVAAFAIVPLLGCPDRPVARIAPAGAYRAARRGALLFVTDGWIISIGAWAWGLVVFKALGERFDALGARSPRRRWRGPSPAWSLAARSTLAARRARSRSTRLVLTTILSPRRCAARARSRCWLWHRRGALGGLYAPSLMTAIYNEAKASPCPLRYHLALEAGWDIGAVLACLTAAAILTWGASLQVVILLALPMVGLQAVVLRAIYAAQREPLIPFGEVAPQP